MWQDFVVSAAATGTRPYDLPCDGFFFSLSRLRAPQSGGRRAGHRRGIHPWPLVTRPTYLGGLGFSMKWNMGWMHDTLAYFELDPVYRAYHHQKLTFSQLYAYSENFVLDFSHDEVVHGKRSLLRKMAGDEWQRFAHLRLLYTYLWSHPGKKLLFMGQEFAQDREWDHDASLDWELLERPRHQGVRRLVADLNRLYALQPALHSLDFEVEGFSWIDCHDSAQSVLSFTRRAGPAVAVIVLNFTPIPRFKYRIGVPLAGKVAGGLQLRLGLLRRRQRRQRRCRQERAASLDGASAVAGVEPAAAGRDCATAGRLAFPFIEPAPAARGHLWMPFSLLGPRLTAKPVTLELAATRLQGD